MRRLALLLFPALLACGETNAEPPVQAVTPQTITYSDIEANNLFGAGCAYRARFSIAVSIPLDSAGVQLFRQLAERGFWRSSFHWFICPARHHSF